MSASAIWTVHCTACQRWDVQCDSKAEAHRDARRHGWLVDPSAGGANVCPDCQAKGVTLEQYA